MTPSNGDYYMKIGQQHCIATVRLRLRLWIKLETPANSRNA
jgi:hypothetical protein